MQIERGLVKTSAGYIHYRAAGRGDAIILLHINQQSSAVFEELLGALGRDFRAIAIDYPSHGMSDHISFQPSIHDYAQCVVEVMDGLGIATAHVLGEATGAAVSIELGVAFADRIGRVIMVNCPIYLTTTTAEARHAPLKGGLRPEDASGFPLTRTLEFMLEVDPDHSPMNPTQSWMDRINLAQIEAGRDRWQALDALRAYDIAANLERLEKPAKLIVGEHFYYAQFCDEFSKRVPSLQVEVVQGGRFCMTWERANEVGASAVAFLGGPAVPSIDPPQG